MISATFDSTKTSLQELLARADNGKLQLPDFQRDWVWDDDRVRSLLASVSESFPIGAVMLLQTGGQNVRFKPRPLTGTNGDLSRTAPESLILDGQQRLTALYQALMSRTAVRTKDAKGKPIWRWYYFDMRKAAGVENDPEDAVVSIPDEKLAKAFGGAIVLDLTGPEHEFGADFFPANRIFNSAECGKPTIDTGTTRPKRSGVTVQVVRAATEAKRARRRGGGSNGLRPSDSPVRGAPGACRSA